MFLLSLALIWLFAFWSSWDESASHFYNTWPRLRCVAEEELWLKAYLNQHTRWSWRISTIFILCSLLHYKYSWGINRFIIDWKSTGDSSTQSHTFLCRWRDFNFEAHKHANTHNNYEPLSRVRSSALKVCMCGSITWASCPRICVCACVCVCVCVCMWINKIELISRCA